MGQKDPDFEGLEIYQRARSLRKKFYDLARGLPEEECYELRAKLKAYVNYLRKSQRGREK